MNCDSPKESILSSLNFNLGLSSIFRPSGKLLSFYGADDCGLCITSTVIYDLFRKIYQSFYDAACKEAQVLAYCC